jgi:ketosteroid isomerase-like protein
MKRTSIILASFLMAILFMTASVFSQTNAEYKAQIEKLNKTMVKDMLSGNTESSMTLYTADAISLPSYEPIREGIDAIRKSGEDMKKSGWKFNSFEPSTLKVLVNGNWITEIGTYKISMSMAGMDKPMDDHGKYLTIWEKQKDGSLKIKIETWNTDVNPMGMMADMDKKK